MSIFLTLNIFKVSIKFGLLNLRWKIFTILNCVIQGAGWYKNFPRVGDLVLNAWKVIYVGNEVNNAWALETNLIKMIEKLAIPLQGFGKNSQGGGKNFRLLRSLSATPLTKTLKPPLINWFGSSVFNILSLTFGKNVQKM